MKCFLSDTKAAVKLLEIIQNKNLRKDVQKMSPQYQTSVLEAFHSLITQYASKDQSYSYIVLLTR